ncbi:MAG: ABC transporter permease, partial [Rhizobiaceae bacterium]
MKRFAKWGLTMPATIAVVVALVIPVLLTIATTFGEPKGA